ncbi:MAG: hypothetical protein WCD49_01705 [Candidatus Acidiferrales bacterium]
MIRAETDSFKYDGIGHRVQNAFTQGSTTTTTNYFYDGVNSIEDVDQNGNVLARYEQSINVDEVLAELRSGTKLLRSRWIRPDYFTKQFCRSFGEYLHVRFIRQPDRFNGLDHESIPVHRRRICSVGGFELTPVGWGFGALAIGLLGADLLCSFYVE